MDKFSNKKTIQTLIDSLIGKQNPCLTKDRILLLNSKNWTWTSPAKTSTPSGNDTSIHLSQSCTSQ